MRSTNRHRDNRRMQGRCWMLLALFLIAFVHPLCAWACVLSPQALAAKAPSPAAAKAPSPAARAHRAASMAASCCHAPETNPAPVVCAAPVGDPRGDNKAPAAPHSCCASHADAFAKPAIDTQQQTPPSSHPAFPPLAAVLPLPAHSGAPMLLSSTSHDRARSALPSLWLASSLSQRAPPARA